MAKYVKISETILGEEVNPVAYTVQYPLTDLKTRLAAAQEKVVALQAEIVWLQLLISEAGKLDIKEKIEEVL